MKEENISLFYCRIGIHHVSELRCALGVYVRVCVCVCVHVCVGFKYSSLHKATLHGLPVCSQIERGLEDFRSILAVAKLFRKHQHRPLTLSLTYQVCYFDMNVSDLKKKKKYFRGREARTVEGDQPLWLRGTFPKREGIDLQSQKNEAWNGRSQIRNMDVSKRGSLRKTF